MDEREPRRDETSEVGDDTRPVDDIPEVVGNLADTVDTIAATEEALEETMHAFADLADPQERERRHVLASELTARSRRHADEARRLRERVDTS